MAYVTTDTNKPKTTGAKPEPLRHVRSEEVKPRGLHPSVMALSNTFPPSSLRRPIQSADLRDIAEAKRMKAASDAKKQAVAEAGVPEKKAKKKAR